MSLSNAKVSVSSPVKRYYQWSGSEGKVTYWDKEKSEKVEVNLPLTFIPIDQLSCVEGYSAKHEKGFRSNEVRATGKEELDVRWNGGSTIVKGLYSKIKDNIEKIGGKYHRSIYGVQEIDGTLEIVNFRFKGAAMSSWLNFDKSTSMNIEGLNVTINKSGLKKTGRVEYYEPTFTATKPTEEEHKLAVFADVTLQDYFKNRGASENEAEQTSINSEEFLEMSGPLSAEEKAQLSKPKSAKIDKSSVDTIEDGDISDLFDSID